MGEIGFGYGSEWHLLRYLGYHRQSLNDAVALAVDGSVIRWLDSPFESKRLFLDREWRGIEFLHPTAALKRAYADFWPQRGNPPNWDAIAEISVGTDREWLLVEAKAHIAELKSKCQANEHGGLETIKKALDWTKHSLCAGDESDWINEYYQFANRLAHLHFLIENKIPARLLFIYFLGDSSPHGSCPQSVIEWSEAIQSGNDALGLPAKHILSDRIHKLFLSVCPQSRNHQVTRQHIYKVQRSESVPTEQ